MAARAMSCAEARGALALASSGEDGSSVGFGPGRALEPMTDILAELAGKALRSTGGSNTIDAIVMASAAQRGDVVYTSEVDDLLGFADVFPNVRVFGVGRSGALRRTKRAT